MITHRLKQIGAISLALGMSAGAMAQQADLITFEPDAAGYLPDGTLAVDNTNITTQYREQYGVSFGFDGNGDLSIDPGTGFRLEDTANSNGNWGYWSTEGSSKYNTAASGFEQQLGDWFLTTDRTQAGSNRLLVTYDNPVTAASGEIWDIDGRNSGKGEQWLVQAFDDDGTVVGSIESPFGLKPGLAGNLDSRPWLWSFDVGNGANISAIVMSNVGTAGNGPVAFNNFATRSTTNELMTEATPVTVSAPEPAFWIMMGSFGLIGGLSHRMASRKASASSES